MGICLELVGGRLWDDMGTWFYFFSFFNIASKGDWLGIWVFSGDGDTGLNGLRVVGG
jgi:hypothetical protein